MIKKKDEIQLTELFMAKAGKHGWDRCYHGVIRRETNKDGNPVCYGKIEVGDGYVVAQANDQWELGEKLDEMVLMVLDYGLKDKDGITSEIAGTLFFLN